jgi:hypothetical protein
MQTSHAKLYKPKTAFGGQKGGVHKLALGGKTAKPSKQKTSQIERSFVVLLHLIIYLLHSYKNQYQLYQG